MKGLKKIAALLLGAVIAAGTMTGCVSTESPVKSSSTEANAVTDGKYKLGITIQSLENSYWAGVFGEVEKLMEEKGWEASVVDCKDNSAQQISQIENFVSAGCNLIMVHPSDPNAIEDVCASARKAGVKVMCWDDKMTNTDLNWILDNTELGYAIGEQAANFINEHYSADDKAEVAIMDYPQTPVLLERENGILSALEEIAKDNYEIVAQQPGLNAGEAQTSMETILQANPDCKVVCTVSAGGDVGSNQAFMSKNGGNIPDDMGIFSADATQEQLQAMKRGEATRASVGFEGSNKRTAEAVVELYEKLLTGEEFEEQNIVRPLTVIDLENVDTFLADYE